MSDKLKQFFDNDDFENRFCADCREKIYSEKAFCSFSVLQNRKYMKNEIKQQINSLKLSSRNSSNESNLKKSFLGSVDTDEQMDIFRPAYSVFICGFYFLIHKSLKSYLNIIKSLTDESWTLNEVDKVIKLGGNKASRKILEKYMPEHWKERIPNKGSTVTERSIFIIEKYDILAFTVFNKAFSNLSWSSRVEKCLKLANNVENVEALEVASFERLVDLFCVVGHNMKIEEDLSRRSH